MTKIKPFLLVVLMLSAFLAQAKIPEYVPPFKIISDTLDPDVAPGKCLITGVVNYNEQPVNEATIKAYNYDKVSYQSEMTLLVNSNKLGNIRMLVDTSTYYLTAWKPGTGTAYVEGVKFKSGHHIIIEIYLPDEMMDVVEKPVIYAYSEEDLDASIQLNTDMDLNFTYPLIEQGHIWNFTTTAHGLEINDKTYPYLFWDAFAYNGLTHKYHGEQVEGFFIEGYTAIEFLEEKLSKLGLNQKEQTDFITYWAPRMINYNYVLVNFLVDEDYNEISTMNISPNPNEIRRVFMMYTGVNDIYSFPDIELYTPNYGDLPKLKRDGFTIIEWGGSEIEMKKL